MGEVDDQIISESQVPRQTKKSVLFAMIMLIIGVFAPFTIDAYNTNSSSPHIIIQGIIWMYRLTSSQYVDVGFTITINPNSWIVMFPFLMLRMVPVRQIFRYYNGKTTGIRVLFASIVGDGLFLFMGLLLSYQAFVTYTDNFHLPLPFQIIFSFIVLLIFRGPKPPVTWESKQSKKSWWETTPEHQQEKSVDDDDILW